MPQYRRVSFAMLLLRISWEKCTLQRCTLKRANTYVLRVSRVKEYVRKENGREGRCWVVGHLARTSERATRDRRGGTLRSYRP